MQSIVASSVENFLDVGHGEGLFSFNWEDPLYGRDELRIDEDGFCSRAMPFYSGQGEYEFLELRRDRIIFRFSESLARRLRFQEQDVEIQFSLNDADFSGLRRALNYLFSSDEFENEEVPFIYVNQGRQKLLP